MNTYFPCCVSTSCTHIRIHLAPDMLLDPSWAVGRVRVGHCQDPKKKPPTEASGALYFGVGEARQPRMRQIAVTIGVTRTFSEFTR